MIKVKQEPDQTQYTHAAIYSATLQNMGDPSYQNGTQDTSHKAC